MNIQTTKRTAELILPKLEAVRNIGRGTIIHDAVQHIAMVNGFLWLLENGDAKAANDLEIVCRNAEAFLKGVPR